jgi:hypothetical protein
VTRATGKARTPRDHYDVEAFVLSDTLHLVRDERGVRLARDGED